LTVDRLDALTINL